MHSFARQLLFLLAWIVPVVAADAKEQGAARRPARPADRFVDSIGVNVHLGYADTTYARFDEIIRPRLLELGVRHVRDACYPGNHLFYRRVADLGTAGIRFSLIADPRWTGAPSNVEGALRKGGDAIICIEGPNELDLTEREGWELVVREYQKSLQRALAVDAHSAQVVLLGPSLGNVSHAAPKVGDLSAYMDFGNAHPYPGGSHVTSAIGGGYGLSFDRAMDEVRRVSGTRPVVITETGYHNNLVRGSHPGVSQEAAGRLLPRLLCHAFNRNVVRTYVYELADQRSDPEMKNMEHHFGLIRTDGAAKPAFVAIRNLIRLLSDRGPRFQTGSLAFALAADMTDLHHLLLQKRDGRFYLILWLDVASHDPQSNRIVQVPERPVTVEFDAPVARVAQYTPAALTCVEATAGPVRTLRIGVTDQLHIIEIVPESAGASAAPGKE